MPGDFFGTVWSRSLRRDWSESPIFGVRDGQILAVLYWSNESNPINRICIGLDLRNILSELSCVGTWGKTF